MPDAGLISRKAATIGISQTWYESRGKFGAGTAIPEKIGFSATVKAAKIAVNAIVLVLNFQIVLLFAVKVFNCASLLKKKKGYTGEIALLAGSSNPIPNGIIFHVSAVKGSSLGDF